MIRYSKCPRRSGRNGDKWCTSVPGVC